MLLERGATIRAWDDVDASTLLAYGFVAVIAALYVSLLALEWHMLGRKRARPRWVSLLPGR